MACTNEIINIILGCVIFCYELLAWRSRDNRITTPVQGILSALGGIIVLAFGYRIPVGVQDVQPAATSAIGDTEKNNIRDVRAAEKFGSIRSHLSRKISVSDSSPGIPI